jgi:hypothetical protein
MLTADFELGRKQPRPQLQKYTATVIISVNWLAATSRLDPESLGLTVVADANRHITPKPVRKQTDFAKTAVLAPEAWRVFIAR